MVQSSEAQRAAVHASASGLVTQLVATLHDGEAEGADIENWIRQLQSTGDVAAVVATLAASPNHWSRLLRTDARPAITAAFTALLGRLPVGNELLDFRAMLAQKPDFHSFLKALLESQEFQFLVLRRLRPLIEEELNEAHRVSAVVAAYRGILGREPDNVGLAAYTEALATEGDLAKVLEEIFRSDEAWTRALKSRSSEIVHELQQVLCGPERPGAAPVPEVEMRSTEDIGGVTERLARGLQHWQQLTRTDSETIVSAVFAAILDRTPDEAELAARALELGESGDLVQLLAEVSRSEEHERAVLARSIAANRSAQAPEESGPKVDYQTIVHAAFQGLLGRQPEEEALGAYSARLRETGDVAAFIAEVGRSKEHRKFMLLQRV
jgi:hypothetical protein